MLGYEEFSLMKSTCLLVNTARPQVVNPEALSHSLRRQLIGGCAMDGYYEEL